MVKRLYPYISDEKAVDLERLEQHGINLSTVIDSGLKAELSKLTDKPTLAGEEGRVITLVRQFYTVNKEEAEKKLLDQFTNAFWLARGSCVDSIDRLFKDSRRYYGMKIPIAPVDLYNFILKFQQERQIVKPNFYYMDERHEGSCFNCGKSSWACDSEGTHYCGYPLDCKKKLQDKNKEKLEQRDNAIVDCWLKFKEVCGIV